MTRMTRTEFTVTNIVTATTLLVCIAVLFAVPVLRHQTFEWFGQIGAAIVEFVQGVVSWWRSL